MKTPTERVIVNRLEYRAILKILQTQGLFYIPGHSSVYVQSWNRKYIVEGKGFEWPDLDGVVEYRPPGECARIELERQWPELRRVGWYRPQTTLLDWRWPMFFGGACKGPMVYTDLVGAYWQIYRRLWLNTRWPCGFGDLDLGPLAGRLEQYKPIRNAVVGIIRSKDTWAWKGHKAIKMHPKNSFLAPELWATIQAILHDIAYHARMTGAIYVATDGYIHPEGSAVIEFQRNLSELGLKYRTQFDEEGEVLAWGSYKISGPEGRITGHYKNGNKGGSPFNAIKPYNTEYKFLDFWAYRCPRYRKAKNARQKASS